MCCGEIDIYEAINLLFFLLRPVLSRKRVEIFASGPVYAHWLYPHRKCIMGVGDSFDISQRIICIDQIINYTLTKTLYRLDEERASLFCEDTKTSLQKSTKFFCGNIFGENDLIPVSNV